MNAHAHEFAPIGDMQIAMATAQQALLDFATKQIAESREMLPPVIAALVPQDGRISTILIDASQTFYEERRERSGDDLRDILRQVGAVAYVLMSEAYVTTETQSRVDGLAFTGESVDGDRIMASYEIRGKSRRRIAQKPLAMTLTRDGSLTSAGRMAGLLR